MANAARHGFARPTGASRPARNAWRMHIPQNGTANPSSHMTFA